MPITQGIRRVLRYVNLMEDGLLIGLLALMIVLAAAQIVMRNVLGTGVAGSDQLLRLLVLWVGLLGAIAASRDDKQIKFDVFSRHLPTALRLAVRCIVDLFTAAVSATVAWQAGRFVHSEYVAGSMAFVSVPAWLAESILPLAFGLITLRYLRFFASHLNQFVQQAGAK